MDRPCFNEIAWRNEAILLESRELENNLYTLLKSIFPPKRQL